MKTIKERMLEANKARTDILAENPEINSQWTPNAVSLMRKLWKEKVEIPVLLKKVDKTLREVDVKLKRSKHVK